MSSKAEKRARKRAGATRVRIGKENAMFLASPRWRWFLAEMLDIHWPLRRWVTRRLARDAKKKKMRTGPQPLQKGVTA